MHYSTQSDQCLFYSLSKKCIYLVEDATPKISIFKLVINVTEQTVLSLTSRNLRDLFSSVYPCPAVTTSVLCSKIANIANNMYQGAKIPLGCW